MAIEDRQSEVIDLFESNRDSLSQETIRQIESALDDWSEMYESDVSNEVLYNMLDEIEDMIEVDNLE